MKKVETQYTYKTISGKTKTVLRATLKAIEWKVRHGISMDALCDPDYKQDIFKIPEAIKTPATMRRILRSIAEQILKNNMLLLKDKKSH